MFIFFSLITFSFLIYGSQCNSCMSKATNCQRSPNSNNIWKCTIKSSDIDLLEVTIFLRERPTKITLHSLYTKQILNSQTSSSPGPGRPDISWSFKGLENLLTDPANNGKEIENIQNLYKNESQRESLKSQCGVTTDLPWFDGDLRKTQTYFVRGHYAPNGDYQTVEDKCSTFHYFNAAPQWHKFNNGNWKNKVEYPIQKLINNTKISYLIYTGSSGQLNYPENNNKLIFIKNKTTNQNIIQVEIPIPKFFFKIISPYAPQRGQKPILIATINHPTMTKSEVQAYLGGIFCTTAHDICDQIPDRSNEKYNWFYPSGFLCEKDVVHPLGSLVVGAGFTYACEATSDIQERLGISLSEDYIEFDLWVEFINILLTSKFKFVS